MTLTAARENARYSKRAVAKALNVSEQTLYNWEQRKSSPDVAQYVTLCKLYGIGFNDALDFFCDKGSL